MMFGRRLLSHCAALVLCVLGAAGEARVVALPMASGLTAPVEIGHANDGSNRLFVVEQGGVIRIVRNGAVVSTAFLDVRALVSAGGERGLLGLAFHPQFPTNGRFFINYTRAGDGATVIASYRVSSTNPDRADPASAQLLLTVAQPFENHNGGTLRFGPDGFLYVGMGDGGSANDPGNRAQDPGQLLGKLLRLDIDHGAPYAIPATNPFASGGGLPEIYALGLRNPWKFSFDRATGDLFIADVGQDAREEIDVVPRGLGVGANFGWRVLEGSRCTGLGGGPACGSAGLTLPAIEYGHDQGCSVTGGFVYRGTQTPALAGSYVYADYCSGRFWAASRDPAGAWSINLLFARAQGPTTFGDDEQGELYFADAATGEIFRLADDAPGIVTVLEFYHAGLDHYFITAAPDEIDALDRGRVAGWARTGLSFNAFAQAGAGVNPVCRFYLPPAIGDSHFFSASPEECESVARRFPGFVLEAPGVFAMELPDPDGICRVGLVPIYRLWNGRADSNHRYISDRSTRERMVARGYIAEGYGAAAVAMCAPQ